MSRFGVFKINGVEYDLDDLTLDEVEQIEDLCDGKSFSEINYGSAKGMKAVTFTLMKRNEPDIKIEDVGKIKVLDFVAADEELPKLPPDEEASPSESEPDGSGPLASVASIAG